MSKIEQLINEIEMYLDSCKAQPFSSNKKIVVEKDVLDEMLVELRAQTPDEIKKYQKIVANRDAILADAQTKAEGIIDDANKQKELILAEHTITQQAQEMGQGIVNDAQARADAIMAQANQEASQVRDGAIAYTENELTMLQNLLTSTLTNTEARYNGFVKQLSDTLEVIKSNKDQLNQAQAEDEPASGGIDVAL